MDSICWHWTTLVSWDFVVWIALHFGLIKKVLVGVGLVKRVLVGIGLVIVEAGACIIARGIIACGVLTWLGVGFLCWVLLLLVVCPPGIPPIVAIAITAVWFEIVRHFFFVREIFYTQIGIDSI
jgi:hypothetical protein